MRFNTRNAYYLRISETAVLPLYLYLDEQHVEWMSERVLQHVLTDLRPLIIPKLIAEESAQLGPGGPSSGKKGTVDVHRGETYQFGYFLRNTEPHSVLVKTRRFTAAPPRQKPVAPSKAEAELVSASSTQKRPKSRKKASKATPANKRQKVANNKGKGKQKASELDSEEEEAIELSADEEEESMGATASAHLPPRRSTRKRAVVAGGYREADAEDQNDVQDDVQDVEMAAAEDAAESRTADLPDSGLFTMESQEDTPAVEVKAEESEPTLLPDDPVIEDDPIEPDDDPQPPTTDTLLNASDSDEEKPKPILKLQYQGFSIRGRALCVIVEPYPPLRKPPRAMSLAPTGIVAPRAPSIAPPDFATSSARAKTPLFLPEDDDRARSVTPAPHRPPVPLFDEGADDGEDGMMAFTQILHSVGEYATGAAEDDDEIEGAVFLGDADEARAL